MVRIICSGIPEMLEVAKKVESWEPQPSIETRDGMVYPNGAAISKEDYPELYAAMAKLVTP